MIQPKPYINKLQEIRKQAIGKERRLNMSKMVLDKGTPFPLPVELKDIDQAFNEWVDKELDLVFGGKKLPTFKLYSNQRINEYAQSWQYLDDVGNLLLNFKTVTRESNPQKGDSQGEFMNIPGNRNYPMFTIPILQENGMEAYDIYTMKQPFAINLKYTVAIIANKYEVLNEMAQMMHDKFKSIDAYIQPNGYYMSMTLEDIQDESENTLDDRKYYSQTYVIKVRGYIIKPNDFEVQRPISRVRTKLIGANKALLNQDSKIKVQIEEEDYIADECCLRVEEDPYYNKLIKLVIYFPNLCDNTADFDIDTDMVIRGVETNNIYDFVMSTNGEFQDFESEIQIYNEDSLHFEIERDDKTKEARLTILGFDPNAILDKRYDPESALDEPISEEIIEVKNN